MPNGPTEMTTAVGRQVRLRPVGDLGVPSVRWEPE
jgi:hypothetical protein